MIHRFASFLFSFICFGLVGQNIQAMLMPKSNVVAGLKKISLPNKNGLDFSQSTALLKSLPQFRYKNKSSRSNFNYHNNSSSFKAYYGYLAALFGGTLVAAYNNEFIKEENARKAISSLAIHALLDNDLQLIKKLVPEILTTLIDEDKGSHSLAMNFFYDLLNIHPTLIDPFVACAEEYFSELCTSKNWRGVEIIQELIVKKPQTVNQFIELAIGHFEELCTQSSGIHFLNRLIFRRPKIADTFLALLKTEDLSSLFKNPLKMHLLINIIHHNPECADQLISDATKCFSELCSHEQGISFLMIAQEKPFAAELFGHTITQHFAELCKSRIGIDFLCKIGYKKINVANQFIDWMKQDFSKLCSNDLAIDSLVAFIQKNPHNANHFIDSSLQNFSTLCKIHNGIRLLDIIIKENPQVVQHYISPAVQDLPELCKNPRGFEFLTKLIKNNPQASYQLAAQAIRSSSIFEKDEVIRFLYEEVLPRIDDESLHKEVYNTIIQHFQLPENQHKAMALRHLPCSCLSSDELKNWRDNNFCAAAACITSCGTNSKCISGQATMTEKHLMHNTRRAKHHEVIRDFFSDPELTVLAKKISSLQSKFEQEGFYPFVHGQRNEYILYEKLFTYLWSLKNNQRIDDFLFAHVKPIPRLGEQYRRKQLLRTGRTYNTDNRKLLLFLNYALFGNLYNTGSNSALYIKENNNIGDITLNGKQCFEFAGYSPKLYEQFKDKIAELEKDYKTLSKYGTALVVAVPKDKIHKNIIAVEPGGALKKVEIGEYSATGNIETIMRALREDTGSVTDSDSLEFCLIMTADKDGGLNPASGIKIIPVMAASDEKLQELKKKEQELFDAIKKAVQK